jgi:hypothetical protein
MDALGFDLYTQMLERTVASCAARRSKTRRASRSISASMWPFPMTTSRHGTAAADVQARLVGARRRDAYEHSHARRKTVTGAFRSRSSSFLRTRVCGVWRRSWGCFRSTRRRMEWRSSLVKRRGFHPKNWGFCYEEAGSSLHAQRCFAAGLTEDEQDNVLDVARAVLLQIRASD